MKLNLSFKEFKKNHSKKKHQILFRARSCKEYYKVENLFKFLLAEKNSNEFEQYEAKARLNLINKIYQSYDENANQKYKVEINQRTIDRVKNSFQ